MNKNTNITKKKIIYLVLKYATKIQIHNRLTGQQEDFKLSGCDGYAPIFFSRQVAEEHSENGKYQIVVGSIDVNE